MTQTEEKLDEEVKHSRGRMYIPHGKGEEDKYKPHSQHIDVSYTECGPDWSSRIRFLPPPSTREKVKENTFYPPLQKLRHFPNKSNVVTTQEYTFYPPHGIPIVYSKGKVTEFGNVHIAGQRTYDEINDMIRFGRKGLVEDARDGYPVASLGDKPYKVPQYSPNFHKYGSTRPVVDFGGSKAEKPDTFIPLQQLPPEPVKPYTLLEAERKKNEEIKEVGALEIWRPATPLQIPTTITT